MTRHCGDRECVGCEPRPRPGAVAVLTVEVIRCRECGVHMPDDGRRCVVCGWQELAAFVWPPEFGGESGGA